jgi:hypothetical protein
LSAPTRESWLETLKARHLCEADGFVCVEEPPGSQWANEVLEQQFVRSLPLTLLREAVNEALSA